MNIALFPSAFAPSLGGVEELVRQLALQLQRNGDNVNVYTNRWPRDLPQEEMIDGLRVIRFPARVPAKSFRSNISVKLTKGAILKKIEQQLRSDDIDVINAHCVSCVTEYATILAKRMKLPLVVTLQGELTMDANDIFTNDPYAAKTFRDSLHMADVVTAVSGKTLSDAENFLGESLGDKGRVIFNGACADDFENINAMTHDKPYIFALGRMVPQKGFDLLLKAFSMADLNNIDLILAGDGPDLDTFRNLANELEISESVKFVGRQNHDQVVAWLKGSKIFVLPSRADEGLPVVIAEAMNAGATIISTRSGGTPEVIIDGEQGLLIDRGDVDQLCEAIKRLGNDEALCEKISCGAKIKSHLVEWRHLAKQYSDAYMLALNTINCLPQHS